jgi:hypothetical protein
MAVKAAAASAASLFVAAAACGCTDGNSNGREGGALAPALHSPVADMMCTDHQLRVTGTTQHALRAEVTYIRFTNISPPTVTLTAEGGHARSVFSSLPANPGSPGAADHCSYTGGVRVAAPRQAHSHVLKVARRYCDRVKITLYPVVQQPYGTLPPTPAK